MISRKLFRKSLNKTLNLVNKERNVISWKMGDFRHVLMDSLKYMPLVKSITWRFDVVFKTTICIFNYEKRKLEVSYCSKTNICTIRDEYSNYQDTTELSKLGELLKSRQPKRIVKLSLKRKRENVAG